MSEHRIPEWRVGALRDAIAKLAKRADRLGVPAPTVRLVDVVEERERDEVTGVEHVRTVAVVEVTGDAPKFAGWTAAAVIDLDPDDRPDGPHVVHTIGEQNPADVLVWRGERDRCDHCTQSPRGRRKLIVCEHENGEQVVVGTTCVRDFLGGTTPEQIAGWFEILGTLDDLAASYEDDDDDQWSGPREEMRVDPADFLAWTASVIEADGWTPRSAADFGGATADQVVEYVFGRPHTQQQRDERDDRRPTAHHVEQAEAALEWARNISDDEVARSDYLANVAAVASKAGWRVRDAGLGASIVAAYRRATEKEIARRAEAVSYAGSQFVGEVGERRDFEATVTFTTSWEGQWGTTVLVRFLTVGGDVLVWYASGWPTLPVRSEGSEVVVGSRGIEQGDRVWLRATVKEHRQQERYGDWLETIVTRAKVSDTAPAPKVRKARKVDAGQGTLDDAAARRSEAARKAAETRRRNREEAGR